MSDNRSKSAREFEGKDKFVERLVAINRVTKVTKGGRTFTFAAIVVVGDENGRIGWGLGKAGEVSAAISKGTEAAKKNLITVPIHKGTIPHEQVARFGGARVFLKREDLNHTGSHKINNVIGQALLAKRMGKTRLIAETGAGQHGVATATAAALFGMECVIYMGEEDTERQALNVARMQLLGAKVIAVQNGSRTLKDAINEALRDWVSNVENTHYLLGTAAGAHPFPAMVRFFHDAIGEEAREQILAETGRLPDGIAACVGGGSNAIGLFHAFLDDSSVEIYGFEAGGDGVETGRHAATITLGRPGMLHGAMTYLMQDEDGQTIESHSISAGLDYPGVGPEHSYLSDIGRVTYEPVTDTEAMDALRLLCRTEGIIPAIESSHALAGALRVCQRWAAEDPEAAREKTMIVCLSGRGDKDMETALKWFGLGKAIPSSTLMTGNKEAAASAVQNAQAESEAK